jgi:hypothetical protein
MYFYSFSALNSTQIISSPKFLNSKFDLFFRVHTISHNPELDDVVEECSVLACENKRFTCTFTAFLLSVLHASSLKSCIYVKNVCMHIHTRT